MSGKTPFQGDNPIQTVLHHVTDLPEPLTAIFRNLNIPGDLNYVVMRCLEKHPDDRYQSADALRDDLIAIRDKRPLKRVEPKKRQVQCAGRLRLQSPALLSLITCLLMVALFFVALEAQRSQQRTAAFSSLSQNDKRSWSRLDIAGQEQFNQRDLEGADKTFEQALHIAERAPDSPNLLKASLNELIYRSSRQGGISPPSFSQDRT